MAGMQMTPTGVKTPLPRDFEVSYEVVAAQNYRWGAHSLTFKLSRTPAARARASFLSMKIPGFDQGEGEVAIEGQFPGAPGYMDRTKWVGAPGFSNNAAINRVTVTLEKKGDLLQVFVGQTKVAEYKKGIPAGLQFNAMSFDLSGNSAEKPDIHRQHPDCQQLPSAGPACASGHQCSCSICKTSMPVQPGFAFPTKFFIVVS